MLQAGSESRRRALLKLGATALLATGRTETVRAQEEPAKAQPEPKPTSEQQQRRERWVRTMKEFRIVAQTEPETVLELEPEPILRWANPIKGGNGLVFLWTSSGRPAAVVCAYRSPWEGGWRESQEFHSLSVEPLTATRENATIWAPREAGVVWQALANAAPPAPSPAARLVQMRAFAREFKVVMKRNEGPTELRLLPQPAYRYEGKTDGALFAFALTTDSDAWLLIEARPVAGSPVWHYAFARMNSLELVARYHDRDVWEAPRDLHYRDPSRPYFARVIGDPERGP